MKLAPRSLDYVSDPEAIYAASFAAIDALPELADVSDALRPMLTRLVHATGTPALAGEFRASPDVVEEGRRALKGGANIFCDTRTVQAGVMRRLLPNDCGVLCNVDDPATASHARSTATTRSAAQFDLWGDALDGQIVLIGNAPTALFRVLEIVDAGIARPAAILAFPVGFVGASESKAELASNPRGIPFATVLGRGGGSGWAQASINAVAGDLEH